LVPRSAIPRTIAAATAAMAMLRSRLVPRNEGGDVTRGIEFTGGMLATGIGGGSDVLEGSVPAAPKPLEA
jgi:hypothetical protein